MLRPEVLYTGRRNGDTAPGSETVRIHSQKSDRPRQGDSGPVWNSPAAVRGGSARKPNGTTRTRGSCSRRAKEVGRARGRAAGGTSTDMVVEVRQSIQEGKPRPGHRVATSNDLMVRTLRGRSLCRGVLRPGHLGPRRGPSAQRRSSAGLPSPSRPAARAGHVTLRRRAPLITAARATSRQSEVAARLPLRRWLAATRSADETAPAAGRGDRSRLGGLVGWRSGPEKKPQLTHRVSPTPPDWTRAAASRRHRPLSSAMTMARPDPEEPRGEESGAPAGAPPARGRGALSAAGACTSLRIGIAIGIAIPSQKSEAEHAKVTAECAEIGRMPGATRQWPEDFLTSAL